MGTINVDGPENLCYIKVHPIPFINNLTTMNKKRKRSKKKRKSATYTL